LPGRYNSFDDNRSDFLIVWGEKIKENYINVGVNPNKIYVSGHPYYKTLNTLNLKFSFDDILVLNNSIDGAHHSDGIIMGDRGNSILYLFSIERELKRLGVKSVRFRPHKEENIDWYYKFINDDFFKPDVNNFSESLKRSTLIIGPTSTVFLESIYYGVNYLVYEPSNEGKNLLNQQLVPPFDGSDSRTPVAKTEDDLKYVLKNKTKVDTSIFSDYISSPFDLSFVKNLIE